MKYTILISEYKTDNVYTAILLAVVILITNSIETINPSKGRDVNWLHLAIQV